MTHRDKFITFLQFQFHDKPHLKEEIEQLRKAQKGHQFALGHLLVDESENIKELEEYLADKVLDLNVEEITVEKVAKIDAEHGGKQFVTFKVRFW